MINISHLSQNTEINISHLSQNTENIAKGGKTYLGYVEIVAFLDFRFLIL